MTSRQRLMAVLSGTIPDRVPISAYELVGYDTKNFCNQEPSYRSLMDYIREKTDCVCMWNPASNGKLCASAYDAPMHSETTPLPDGRQTRRTLTIGGRTLTSTSRWIDNIHTTWNVEHWCKDLEDVDALMSLPYVPVDFDASDYARVSQEVGERGILMASLSDPAYLAMLLMEFGEATIWAMTETEHFAKVVETLHDRNMQNLERQLNAVTVDLYRICGPEYMTPPYLPRPYFERFMVPYLKEMTALIHSHGAKVRLHSHGRIGTLLDLYEDIGVDATDPCEAPPDGDIELAEVKRRIGGGITLFGNLQLKLLEGGTEEAVRAEVRRAMEAGKPGGRFVIMPTAAPINVPLAEKTEALYRAFIDEALALGPYA